MNKKSNMKKGITLIEIILAIVLIAIILGITIPKLMSNSAQAEIKQTISSDLKSIVEAAELWRKSSATADGVYNAISVDQLRSRLPRSMAVDIATGLIYSSGLRTGINIGGDRGTGVMYTIWYDHKPAQTNDNLSFAIGIDTTLGVYELGWDARLQAYARDVFNDVINDLARPQGGGFNNPVTTDVTIVDGAAATTVTTNNLAATAGIAGGKIKCSDTTGTVCIEMIKVQ